MEQRLERALITTTAFGFVAVSIAVGVGSAIECGAAAAGCYLATGFVQRRMPGRRVANAVWERRRLRQLDENLSRRSSRQTKAARPGRDRQASRTAAARIFDGDERVAEPFPQSSYGW